MLVLAATLPLATGLLGLYLMTESGVSGSMRLLFGIGLIACIYLSVRLVKIIARPLISWRSRASFLRQLERHKHRSGL